MTKFVSAWVVADHDKTNNSIGQLVTDYKLVDIPALAKQIEAKYNDWHANGIEVVNVIPIITGAHEPARDINAKPVGVASYSITRGVILIGKS